MRPLLAVLAFLCSLGIAFADDAPAPAPAPTPPQQPTTLVGRVTDILGKPVEGARIYVMSGHRTQTGTDKDGRYSLALYSTGAHSVVIAVGKVHTYRQVLIKAGVATTLDVEVEIDSAGGGEVIKITDRRLPPPAVMPRPTIDKRVSLPYSDEAKARDAWARAWILLDVDERGTVSRIKLLKRPGFGLDQIAIDESFKLKFEPARDEQNRPIRTYIVWTMEWPSWGWLVSGQGIASGKPNEFDALDDKPRNPGTGAITSGGQGGGGDGVRPRISRGSAYWAMPPALATAPALSRVPCAGSGPLNLDLRNRSYRDCSQPPNPEEADALPWITRENAATALAELARTEPKKVRRPRGSRLPEITATAVTGVIVVGFVTSYFQWNKYSERTASTSVLLTAEQRAYDIEQRDKWEGRLIYFGGAALLSGAVTAFLWSRGQSYEEFSVQPTKGGATVSLGKSF